MNTSCGQGNDEGSWTLPVVRVMMRGHWWVISFRRHCRVLWSITMNGERPGTLWSIMKYMTHLGKDCLYSTLIVFPVSFCHGKWNAFPYYWWNWITLHAVACSNTVILLYCAALCTYCNWFYCTIYFMIFETPWFRKTYRFNMLSLLCLIL